VRGSARTVTSKGKIIVRLVDSTF